MQKMKKLVAFLLVLVMVVSLLPTVSFAADGEDEAPDPVIVSKSYSNGILTLTAYGTGQTITTIVENPVPADIVLVLDVSGSMDEAYSAVQQYVPVTANFSPRAVGNSTRNTQYYYKDGENYYPVRYTTSQTDAAPVALDRYFNILRPFAQHGGNMLSTIEIALPRDWTRFSNLYYLVDGQPYPVYYKGRLAFLSSYYTFGVQVQAGAEPVPLFDGAEYINYTRLRNVGQFYRMETSTQYQLVYANGTGDVPFGDIVYSQTATAYNETLYRFQDVYDNKMEALKASVEAFLDEVEQQSYGADGKPGGGDDVAHRVSIVKYAGNYFAPNTQANTADPYQYEDNLTEGNTRSNNGYNSTEVVKNLTVVKDHKQDLVDAVEKLQAGGATAADYGMRKAEVVLSSENEGYYNSKNNKVVVMFTDGEPNHQSGFDPTVANDTIQTSRELKNSGVTVYSIGLLENPSNNTRNYMEAVCSDYPNATAYNALGSRTAEGYFQNASGDVDLRTIFRTIASAETSGGSTGTLSDKTILRDVCSEYFEIDAEVDSGSDVKVYTEEYNGSNKWINKTAFRDAIIDISDDGKSIDVSGFDYSWYYVDPESSGNNANGVRGRRLVVEVPVKLDDAVPFGENAVYDKGTNTYKLPTNAGTAGIYDDLDKNPMTAPELVEPFVTPYADNTPYFTIVHKGTTAWGDKEESHNYAVIPSFDFTEAVTPGTIYGGTFTDSACQTNPVADGKNTSPDAHSTYYLWEVSSDHLKPKNLCAYADNKDGYYVEAVYLVTAVDRDAYKNVGFIVSDNKTLANASQIEVDASNGYADVNSKKVAYEKIQLTQGGKTVGTYTYYQAYGKIAPTTENSLISCYRLDTISNVPFYSYKQENPFYFKAFWTTLDNVLVASSDAREAYYQSADGKSLVVTDHEGYRFWAVHAQKVLDDNSLGEATGSAPLKMMASYSYDQEDSADTVAVPMRMLLAAPKPPVEEPDEPIDDPDDPVIPETPECINVVDNGESYQAQIIAGAVTLEPVGANGKVFAGWYADKAYTKVADLSAVQDGETVYAKYISDDYLSVKYTASILAKKLTLISAIDARDYAKTGFIIENGSERKVINVSSYSNSYLLVSAKSLFGSSLAKNAPIMTCELNLAGVKKNTAIKVTPFAIAKDGTEIIGETRTMVYTGFSIKG